MVVGLYVCSNLTELSANFPILITCGRNTSVGIHLHVLYVHNYYVPTGIIVTACRVFIPDEVCM